MLTTRHLAVIRAALKFWDEEMSPHGTAAFTGYADEPIVGGELTSSDVTHVRKQLDRIELRYAVCDEDVTELIGGQLFETAEEAESAQHSRVERIVTVLVPSGVS